MRLRHLIIEEKVITSDTGWRDTTLRPKDAPILTKTIPTTKNWQWRSSTAIGKDSSSQFVLLLRCNPLHDKWNSVLMQKIGERSASVIARYEHHGNHPGLHGHAHCERGGVETGSTGMDRLQRIPESYAGSYHRRIRPWTKNAFWESAKRFFRLCEKKGSLL